MNLKTLDPRAPTFQQNKRPLSQQYALCTQYIPNNISSPEIGNCSAGVGTDASTSKSVCVGLAVTGWFSGQRAVSILMSFFRVKGCVGGFRKCQLGVG